MRIRVLVAVAAAFVLLSSGLGTGAAWFQEQRFDEAPVEVSSGSLHIDETQVDYRVLSRYSTDTRFSSLTDCTVPDGFDNCAELSRRTVEGFRFMRGDRLIVESRFQVETEGRHLSYTVEVTGVEADPPSAWAAMPTEVTPAGPVTGSRTVTVSRTYDFDEQVSSAGWESAFGDLRVPTVTVQAVQEDR